MKDFYKHLNNGRIGDIISSLEKISGRKISGISIEDKLFALCDTLKLSVEQLDIMIANNSPVMRTVKGHTFEVALQRLFEANHISVKDIGGDSEIDLCVNDKQLQLKTPNMGGTTDTSVEYKTHKTHGAKSESESMDYYHDINSFADFFVGLISYVPFKILIIPKTDLPRHRLDNHRIISPFKINLTTTKFINRFDLLDLKMDSIDYSLIKASSSELLPYTSRSIGVSSSIIIDTIMRNSNFRIWDMSIRGFAREIALKLYLDEIGVVYRDDPQNLKDRGEKADLAMLSENGSYSFVQVKGCSVNNCCFEPNNIKIATETQLTRGRVNDHPTQSRLYMSSDFDFLSLCIDPPLTYKLGLGAKWLFCLIPSSYLKKHTKYPSRYATIQSFSLDEIIEHQMSSQNLKAFHLLP